MNDNNNRFCFPNGIVRVTAGFGGEAILVFGSEKTAMVDCGMAYCHERMLLNIEKTLKENGRESIDYILLSHSHYDHIGALPYIKKRWPNAIVCGAKKCKDVFDNENAKFIMKTLGESARELYGDVYEKSLEIEVSPMVVDRIVGDGDKIMLSDCASDLDKSESSGEFFYVIETKGHTDCSLTYVFEPMGIMFTSESTGVMRDPEYIHTAILKSYNQTIESALKCKAYAPKRIISPHFGIVEEEITEKYFDLYIKMAEIERDLVLSIYEKEKDQNKILEEYTKVYWNEEREKEQPKEAFLINAVPIIRTIIRECAKTSNNV